MNYRLKAGALWSEPFIRDMSLNRSDYQTLFIVFSLNTCPQTGHRIGMLVRCHMRGARFDFFLGGLRGSE